MARRRRCHSGISSVQSTFVTARTPYCQSCLSVNTTFGRRRCPISMKLAGIYRYDGLQCSCMECKILPVHLLFLLNLTKKTLFWAYSPTQCRWHLQMKSHGNPWGSFVYPVMLNTLARKFPLSDQNCKRQLDWLYRPIRHFLSGRHKTDNRGACSNLVVRLSYQRCLKLQFQSNSTV